MVQRGRQLTGRLAGWGGGLVAIEGKQQLAFSDRLAFGDEHLDDAAGSRRGYVERNLAGFEQQDDVVGA